MANQNIEAGIMRYVRETAGRGELPNRDEAVRYVTGQMPVLPSAVAKEITRIVEAKLLVQRSDGQLSLPR